MAVTSTLSNHFKYQLYKGNIDFDTDDFKIILMNTTFAFDKDADATLADVTSDQLATNYGYTQDSKSLAGVSITEDDVNDKAYVTWNDVTWTASGGTIGASGAAIIYDDTTSDDTVVGCIDFGEDLSAPAGIDFQVKDLQIDLT
ncbi:MAG: hypothetical protein DRH26_06795 [Deltaproteobacteria bacterium]|nr:MAG: hypothetical protein DRH26_06795 [Deltaproteobacteria bacterium]